MKNERILLDYSYIVIGSAITAFSVVAFLNPAQLAPGGVSGIATLLYYAAGWDLSTTIFIINIPIFLIGMKLFGKQYGFCRNFPVDTYIRIIPGDGPFALRGIETVALILEDSFIGKDAEPVGKPSRNEKLPVVVTGQFHGHISAV